MRGISARGAGTLIPTPARDATDGDAAAGADDVVYGVVVPDAVVGAADEAAPGGAGAAGSVGC